MEKVKDYSYHANCYVLDSNENVIGISIVNLPTEILIADFNKINKSLKKFIHLENLTIQLKLGNLKFVRDLHNLKSLNLDFNDLTDISILSTLTNLEILSLSSNGITDINPLYKLAKLKELNLYRNPLKDLEQLKHLKFITSLHLSHISVWNSRFLKDLVMLKVLKLDHVEISDLTDFNYLKNLEELIIQNGTLEDISNVKSLNSLTDLNLLSNNIKDISPLKDLHKIKFLNLGRNNIEQIEPLKNNKNLESLWLIKNKIKDCHFVKKLINLDWLSLAENEIDDISFLQSLTKLTTLHLQDNNIINLESLANLNSLQNLSLSNNKIEDISCLKNLKHLDSLQLQRNPIRELPDWITNFSMDITWNKYGFHDNQITFFENPLITPPIEIVSQGKAAIKRYFDRLKIQGQDFIYEAKLTLVGEGNAGKTSLEKRLLNPKSSLPKKDTRTRGIKIYDWNFKRGRYKNQIAHIWDFGGQDVYYPVHRFFITENSVFVLLASTRQTTHNFDYWIPTIYQFGGSSPIILGQTCHDGNKVQWNDLGYYLGHGNFNIVKTQTLPYYELNLPNNNEGLSKIKDAIIKQITSLPHYGKGVPSSWVIVRNIITELSKRTACISFETFKDICKDCNPKAFEELIDIRDCAKFLHSIGVILWYSENDILIDWIVLQPEWAMNAVYKIIDDSKIIKRTGHILASDFVRLWSEESYQDKHLMLKQMLEVFKISFPKKHPKGDYIIPARLLSMPNISNWQLQIDNPYLRLEYKYEFMPRGIVNQLSADLSRFIKKDDEVWNNAINFCNKENTAECQVEEDFYNRKITIKAKGMDARGLIMIVKNGLDDITEGYKGVKANIYVPCICKQCERVSEPEKFSYEKLIKKIESNENARVTCNVSDQNFFITELLFLVGLPVSSKISDQINMAKTIKLFLASSSELKDDRAEFEIFINRENKKLNKKGIFIELNLWEHFIDSMSKTGLQSEYNKVVKESDIFVSLFFTKVGKYTEQEFKEAFKIFSTTGKPFIYTYFKNAQINSGNINKEMNTRLKFMAKLKSMGHYPTEYTNIDNLKYQFKNQLEEILDKF